MTTDIMQNTIKNSITCEGVGLHSGQRRRMTLHPADANSGIIFRRSDVVGCDPVVPARYDLARDCVLCTTLTNNDGVSVSTVEHLMAALAGAGIDNIVVEIDGPEVPVMDGSADPFLFLIECAGVLALSEPRKVIRICKTISVGDEHRGLEIAPADDLSIRFDLDYENRFIGRQFYQFTMNGDGFKNEISASRTFGLEKEVEGLRTRGLALGGSLENAVVVGDSGVLNPEGLRYADECVRHKILDLVGDLYLAGAPLIGSVRGRRSGHAMNNQLVRAVLENRDAWALENQVVSANSDDAESVEGKIRPIARKRDTVSWAEPVHAA